MRGLSFIIVLLFSINTFGQSPHGNNFKMDCADCHTSQSWQVSRANVKFDHDKTQFPLAGQHKTIDCRMCHETLIFTAAKTDCFSCHKDIHKNSVGTDCAQCHNPQTWLVTNINEVHQLSRFPLVGVHLNQDCSSCHTKFSELNFEVLGIECYDCHSRDYLSAKSPDHQASNLSKDCIECHSITSPVWSTSNFTHDFFPLTGGHKIAACSSCHTNGVYKGLSSTCYSCHQKDYGIAKDPDHIKANFDKNCTQCHTITTWGNSTFDHSITGFALTGAHKNQACDNCHSSGYANISNECTSCHQGNYNQTTDPNHIAAGFPVTCKDCHSTNSWKPATFDHDSRFFPVYSGKHNGTWNACSDCHTNQTNFADFSCITCHEHNQQDMNSGHSGVSGYVYQSDACFSCHPLGSKEGSFNHSISSFPLLGKHAAADCKDCHQTGYANTSTECYSCHNTNYNSSVNPNHTAVGIATACESCHNSEGWAPSTFNHSSTSFILAGSHINVKCESCHNGKTAGTDQQCYSCHSTNYNTSGNPNHAAAGIATTCESCHNSESWVPSTFNHSITAFILTGSHLNVKCESCHIGKTTGTDQQCYGCHKTNYDATTNPNHKTSNFAVTCEQCHTTTAWQPASFDHSTTQFPLTGKHVNAGCASCHQNGYTNTPTDCSSCHKSDYDQTQNPNHITASFPTTCIDCHTTDGWTPATFDHDARFFPIYSGKHNGQWNVCSDCHVDVNNYQNFSCITCHEHNQQDTDQKHNGISGYIYQSSECFSCHPAGSKDGAFNHDATAFPLLGSHKNVQCKSCHTVSYANTSTECNSCHNNNYKNTANPNHTAVGIVVTCQDCHDSNAWSPSSFNHANTVFALVGKHTEATCESCHKGQTAGTTQQCIGCHQNSFDNSVNPNHKSVGLSTECQTCHTPSGWSPSSFNHSNTTFTLTGAHISAPCESCHKGQTTGTTQQCYGCHKSNFDGTTNPNHATSGFPVTCEQCHTTSAWQPATFDHNKTNFPLTGKHTSVSCSQCHSAGYTNTPTDCNSCHINDYKSTTNPNHTALNFPLTCADCHTTSGWTPATFDHDGKYFPIYSGKHRGTWNTCADCHTVQSNYASFSCIDCHAHNNKTSVDRDHQNVNNYIYQSGACYNCHPTGRSND